MEDEIETDKTVVFKLKLNESKTNTIAAENHLEPIEHCFWLGKGKLNGHQSWGGQERK